MVGNLCINSKMTTNFMNEIKLIPIIFKSIVYIIIPYALYFMIHFFLGTYDGQKGIEMKNISIIEGSNDIREE